MKEREQEPTDRQIDRLLDEEKAGGIKPGIGESAGAKVGHPPPSQADRQAEELGAGL